MDQGLAAEAEALRQLIQTTPIIDNHAHPLLKKSHLDQHSLLSITSEASGDALDSSRTSLAHIRAVRLFSEQLGCAQSWEAVESAIKRQRQRDYAEWTRQCLDGIGCVLVDDGLDDEAAVESYQHFDQFVPSASKRIVRIEHVAAQLIENACTKQDSPEQAFGAFLSQLKIAIKDAIADKQVVSFKSVICYRTGLDIAPNQDEQQATAAFAEIFRERRLPGAARFARLHHRPLNELIVHLLAQTVRDASPGHKKPIQFHTGLGDNDLTLTRASPAHLQNFVRAYPTVPIVLLHSGYPFDREMGYMAAMYANVYADIGEVFSCLSRSGLESILRHMLELCPWDKIIWSTDGHWFPETYRLSVLQMRDVFHALLCEFVQKRDLSWEQASQLVQDVLFNTSNRLYHLGLSLQQHAPCAREAASATNTLTVTPGPQKHHRDQLLEFLATSANGPHYLRQCWVDYTGTLRARDVPSRQIVPDLQNDRPVTMTVTEASLGLMQDDHLAASEIGPSGHYKLLADLSSLRSGPKDGISTLMCDFQQPDGTPARLCPRRILKTAVEAAADQGLRLKFGFEIELMLLRPTQDVDFKLQDAVGHAWSSARALNHEVVDKVLRPAIEQLDKAGVYVEMLHSESAQGQFEVVLPPAEPLEAVDVLVYARHVISTFATQHGYRMTLHPKPIADACGTAAHTHMSVEPTSADSDATKVYESFYAGILTHLRAICAFSYSSMVSYERVQDGVWAGGTWVAWGTQNRETPLRKIEHGHWEVKCIDGLANPYFVVAALVAAGCDGVKKEEKLLWGDCAVDPATLSPEARLKLGIRSKLPSSIGEALASLEKDSQMVEMMGRDVVARYIVVKKAETSLLMGMDADTRKKWIVDRY